MLCMGGWKKLKNLSRLTYTLSQRMPRGGGARSKEGGQNLTGWPPKKQKVPTPSPWYIFPPWFWRKRGVCDTFLAEACPLKLWNTVKYRVEVMRPNWPFWKHRMINMRPVDAQCAHRKHCYVLPKPCLGDIPLLRSCKHSDCSSVTCLQ